MEERRKLPRKYLMAFSSVIDNNSGMLLGYLNDLTLNGLMVISKVEKDVGIETELYIELPEVPKFPKKSLLIKARIIWCEADIDPRLYNIGFHFLRVSAEDKIIIEQMIDAYEFRRDQDLFPPSVSEINKSIQ